MKKLSVSVSNDVWNRIYLLSSRTSISETVRTLLVMGLAHIERPKANVPKAEVKLAKKPSDVVSTIFIIVSIYGLGSIIGDVIRLVGKLI